MQRRADPPDEDDEVLESKVRSLEHELLKYRIMEMALARTNTLLTVMNLDSKITFASDACRSMFGYRPSEMVGHRGFTFIHPDDRGRLVTLLGKYVREFVGVLPRLILEGVVEPITETVEYRVRTASGSWCWVESVGTVIEGKIYCVSREITQRRQHEEERDRMQSQLARTANLAALGTLSAGIAHELNNPMTAVIGLAEMIEENAADEDFVAARARRIKTAAERMRAIVEQVGRFSRQTRSSERQHVDLNETIRSALLLLEQVLEDREVDLTLELADDLPPISGNPSQLESVFHNLVINAVDAFGQEQDGDDRERLIRLTSRPDGDEVLIVVEDNASGMSEEVAQQAFDPFFTTKEVGRGTGLGLAVTHGIIRDHAGSITLSTELGVGTRFEVRFPGI